MHAETGPANGASEALTERQAVEEGSLDCGTVENLLLLPDPKITADSLDHLVEQINESVKDAGYSLDVQSSWKSISNISEVDRAMIVCTNDKSHRGEQDETIRKKRKVDKELDGNGCPMHLYAQRNDRFGQWSYTYSDMYHNHGGLSDPAAFSSHGPVSSEETSEILNCYLAGMKPQTTLRLMKERNKSCTLVLQDIYNCEISFKKQAQEAEVVADTDEMESEFGQPNVAEALLGILKQSADGGSEYFWRVAFDSDGRVENLFLAKETQIAIYEVYPDILILDSTQKKNLYKMSVLNFVGCTGANTETHIALALLRSDRDYEADYEWALGALKEMNAAYCIPDPTVCFVDRERRLTDAIEKHFQNCPTLLSLDKIYDKAMNFAKRNGFSLQINPDNNQLLATGGPFLSAFDACIRAKSETDLERAIYELRLISPKAFTDLIVSYFGYWRREVSAVSRDRIRSFAFTTTSPGKVSHNALKSWLKVLPADAHCFWSKLQDCWTEQNEEFTRIMSLEEAPVVIGSVQWYIAWNQKVKKYWRTMEVGNWKIVPWSQRREEIRRSEDSADPSETAKVAVNLLHQNYRQLRGEALSRLEDGNRFWAKVNGHIHLYALQQTLIEYGKREDTSICTGVFSHTRGIPCRHLIARLISYDRFLQLNHFDEHWWIRNEIPSTRSDPPKYLARPAHERGRAAADSDSDTSTDQ